MNVFGFRQESYIHELVGLIENITVGLIDNGYNR